MWGIQFEAVSRITLPLITLHSILSLLFALLFLRLSLHFFLDKLLSIDPRKDHNPSSLEYSYFYHLCILVLVLSDVRWNMFDVAVWVAGYICMGMLRKTLHVLNVERDYSINDYAYSCAIVGLLKWSRAAGFGFLGVGIVWVLWAHVSFLGVPMKYISLLCFPAFLLILDSLFTILISSKTKQNLIFFFNQNIYGESPILHFELKHKIVGSAIRIWHYANLSFLCCSVIYDKIDFLDCLWVISALGAFYTSAVQLISSITKYKKANNLNKLMANLITRAPTELDRICIVCRDPLLNSFKLNICGHCFHYKCLSQWVQTKEECPICRVRLHAQ